MKSCERVTSLDWKPFTASKALKLTTSQVMESWAIERKCSEHGDEQSEEHPSSFHLQEALRSCSSLHVCKSSKSFLLCKGESWNFQSFARPSTVHLYFQLATWNCDTDIYMRSKQLSLLGSLRLCRTWSFLFPNFSAGHLPWDCNAMQAFRLSTTKWSWQVATRLNGPVWPEANRCNSRNCAARNPPSSRTLEGCQRLRSHLKYLTSCPSI